MRATLFVLLLTIATARGADNASKEVARLRKQARAFAERDRPDDAERTLVEALAYASTDIEILRELMQLNLERPDPLALWARVVADRATDAKGRAGGVGSWPRPLSKALEPELALARNRAKVVDRLVAQAKKMRKPKDAALAHYQRGLFRTATAGVPALRDKHAGAFDDAIARCRPDAGKVMSALEKAMLREHRSKNHASAVRAASILKGLAVQAKRTKTKVARLEAMRTSATLVLNEVRASKPALTVKDLLDIPEEDRPKWEREHSDWSNPTVVVSPNGLYRVESICGVRTTLMVASDVEYCHHRLARWFGKDPFEGQQGTVRVVPTPADLDREGSPHWWAGGFQGGPITTIAASATSRDGIANVLTHELTHRFDGALNPMMPAWLVEGRAVYSATCSGWPRASAIDPRFGNGSCWTANTKGYRGEDNLKKLIAGNPDDYRDNYPVGYTLWVYFHRHRGNLYAERVQPYMNSFKSKRGMKPEARFKAYFLDGKKGRPDDWKVFFADWSKWVGEGASLESYPWKKAWNGERRAAQQKATGERRKAQKEHAGQEIEAPYDREILDRSNWKTFRARGEEPDFGEGHAYAAGLWFEEHKLTKDAALAFTWAREVDETTSAQFEHIAAFHKAAGKPGQAWLVRLAARERSLGAVELARAPGSIAPSQAIVLPLLDEHAKAEAAHRAAERKRIARVHLADRAALAQRAGIALDNLAADDVRFRGLDAPPADSEPYASLLSGGLVPEIWTPAESKKTKSFHIAAPRTLVLGSKKPLATTSGFRRDAGVRKFFFRGNQWLDGTYTVRTRVSLVSAHLNAALMIGHTRHDRALVVTFSGGDWAYAVGKKKETAGFAGIGVSLSDRRTYDGGVSRMATHVDFRSRKTSFLVTIRVSGSFVRVFIDDRAVLSHRTATGVPIEGRVGYYLGSGLVAFENPVVRRHRAMGPEKASAAGPGDASLSFDKPCRVPYDTWQGRRVTGLPRDPHGTLLLCYGKPHGDPWKHADEVQDALTIWSNVLDEASVKLRVRALVPKEAKDTLGVWNDLLPADSVALHAGLPAVDAAVKKWIVEEAKRRAGRRNGPDKKTAEEQIRKDLRMRPVWVAIDQRGIVRATGLWMEGPYRGRHRTLIRRLRGY
ncbi:MAG: hypothetical protein ACYTGZ_13195 [Planctomycetota bacterium]